jgi:hypothetical protein
VEYGSAYIAALVGRAPRHTRGVVVGPTGREHQHRRRGGEPCGVEALCPRSVAGLAVIVWVVLLVLAAWLKTFQAVWVTVIADVMATVAASPSPRQASPPSYVWQAPAAYAIGLRKTQEQTAESLSLEVAGATAARRHR